MQVLLRFPDVFLKQAAGIEFQQLEIPFAGHGLGAKTFAATLNTEDQDALGRIEAIPLGLLRKRAAAQ